MHTSTTVHRFAIAANEVTVQQFLRFDKEHSYDEDYAPELVCPVNRVQWYDAAAYCNWLSEQEGIDEKQWCYRKNQEDEFRDGMTIAPNYLELRGYRLPTEQEWEHACRGGFRRKLLTAILAAGSGHRNFGSSVSACGATRWANFGVGPSERS